MTTIKRITDLTEYTNVLPYASELFGVYQPLLGWKSKRLAERYKAGFKLDRSVLLNKLKSQFTDLVNYDIVADNSGLRPENSLKLKIKPGVLNHGEIRTSKSLVLDSISSSLPTLEKYKPSVWARAITERKIDVILSGEVAKFYSEMFARLKRENERNKKTFRTDSPEFLLIKNQLAYESTIAGALLFLVDEKSHSILQDMFYNSLSKPEIARTIQRMINAKSSTEAFLDIENLDPTEKEQLKGVTLSPISVVHLFRQYFFELDTFLGTPEGHVWLSPGSSVELIEEHTRKTTIEKTFETTLDILTKSEVETTVRDEISDAVRKENSKNIKLGASVTASYAGVEATSSFDYESSQNKAREKTHKSMREQTEKLSSEIRKNFKTTFRTVTEFTEFNRTKHLLNNTTDDLINYELRRKMRQVGVQVQDIGTYLCWQTYVDDPGRDLGLSKLIHIAQSAELGGLQHPEAIPLFQPVQEEKTVTIPFISVGNVSADKKGEVYVLGVESDNNEFLAKLEKIKFEFPMQFISPKPDYELSNIEFDAVGLPVTASRKGSIQSVNGRASFTLRLDSANFQGRDNIQIKLTLHWSPNEAANAEITEKNRDKIDEFKVAEKEAYESAYIETVKDRVNAISNIKARDRDELREEERIVVYRKLIQDMLLNKVSSPDDRTMHVLAELINSIFDVNKMLYFVAPEWWRPRLHKSKQQLYEATAAAPPKNILNLTAKEAVMTTLDAQVIFDGVASSTSVDPDVLITQTAGWGGIEDTRRDNYYITEESEPAKFGSSLGWLLQLDGDNMRNAFLNAPWVKAVMPIRPGKEKAAINWLKAVEGMNGITEDVIYHASNPEEKDIDGEPLDGQPMIDVLMDLASKIERKHKEGLESEEYPKTEDVSDPALVDEENTVTATPIDRVYEHGFFPLKDSFRANIGKNYEIFDQWIEILPTDQTVPVEVKYDPKTGRQV